MLHSLRRPRQLRQGQWDQKVTLPIRERILDIRDDDEYISRVVRRGAEQARDIAADTLRDVREIMGIRKF